jgi:acyl-CoA thioester hydrolase
MTLSAPSPGGIADGVHQLAIRVYYEDTDAAGIVYYANYLKFAERARTEMMRVLGFDHEQLRRDHDMALAVRRCAVDYFAPAKLDDALVVGTRILSAAGAALELEQEVRRDGVVLARLELRIACLNTAGRPRRIPPALAAAAAGLSRHTSTMVPQHAR